jgi:DNA-directed RNA polymerase subunit RPC12/RpoP
MREPLDCFRDKRVTDLVLCFGTQTGKTMTVMGGTGYRIANDPANALWVMPNRDLCKSFTQTRWFPFIENCAPLNAMRPSGADRHLWTRLEQYFSRSTLTWVGSNSPSNLASRPAGLLLMDEIDKFELKSDREAGALQNAEERTKASTYPLRVKTSTPTTKYGEIWKEFQMGDQRFFFLPCPHCRTKIRLEWGQVRWWDESDSESKTDGEWDLEKVRKNTYYRCQACEQKIYDSQKTVMLREGEWQPTATNGLLGRRSYHLNSLYAPLKETQWGNLAVKWLMTKGSATRRQAFINSTLAEPWDNELLVDDETINVITYSPSELPDDRIPVMTVDVQENHFWVVVRSWGNPKMEGGQQSWLLHEGRIETIEEVEKLAQDLNLDPRRVGVDMAHKPNTVSSILIRNGWRGLWGSDKTGFLHSGIGANRVIKDYSPIQYRDPHLGTVNQSEGNDKAMFVFWSNDRIKDRLAVLRDGGRWHVNSNVSKEYIHQINAESKEMKRSPATGRVTYYWKRVRKSNHMFDCEAMQVVMALVGGVLQDDTGDPSMPVQTALNLAG